MTKKKKTLLKTITWRLTATLTTMILVFLLSGEMKIAGTIAIFEVSIKMAIYYFHERAWDKVETVDAIEYHI